MVWRRLVESSRVKISKKTRDLFYLLVLLLIGLVAGERFISGEFASGSMISLAWILIYLFSDVAKGKEVKGSVKSR